MLLRNWKLAFQLLVCAVLSLSTASAQVTADFSATVTSGCSPLIVQFTDLSTGPVISWSWSFGNSNVSNQRNPGAIYNTPGCYTVRLIVFDGVNRDTLIKPCYITVFQDPTVDIAVDTSIGCTPLTVNFTDNSTPGSAPITNWIWDFGDGNTSTQPNPSHVYLNAGCYHVTLSLIDGNGCTENRTYPNMVCVGSIPTVDFGSDVNAACFPPLTVNFIDSSSGSSALTYHWDFGDATSSTMQNPSHIYAALGTYDLKLRVTDQTGCTDSVIVPDFVAIEDLVADFSSNVAQGCVGQAVQFTDLSTSNPNNWTWSFGDAGTANVKDPLHVYNTPGVYTVTLIAANSGACSDTVTKSGFITIHPSPVADFSADVMQSCSAPLTVNFSDLSANAVSWQWDFGDGNTSTAQNPSNTYLTVDSFTVTLIVGNVQDCYDTIVKSDFIRISPPQVAFDGQGRYGCIPREVQFEDSTISINPIVSWLWDFGDGNFSTDQHPLYTYNVPNSYHVSLTVADSDGCIATLTDSNFVGAGTRPTANFTANPIISCIFLPVNFFNSSVGSSSWRWEFGDGGISDEFEPQHTYGDTGYFTIRLISREHGCPDTLELVDYVYVSPPDAIFTVAYDCSDPLTVSFIDGSLAPDTWHWDFGDGNTSTIPSPTHTYAAPGTYHVILTCTNTTSGCIDIQEQDIIVTGPVADFMGAPTFGCKPHTVTLTDISADAVSWAWLAGGMSSTAQNPSFTFNNAGVYDVRLIITDIHGCRDTMLKPAYVTVTGPTANFSSSPNAGCAPLLVSFTDLSTQYLSPITDWHWNFGDGDTSALQNPTHTYNNIGSYSITLTVTDSDGCSHAITRTNQIQPTFPAPDFSADTFSCTGRAIQFVNMSSGSGMSFLWNFGDGTPNSTATNPSHLYAYEDTFTVSLTVTDVNGCDSTLTKVNYIRIADPIADFAADDTFAPCPPLLVNFADSSNDATTWRWSFGDNTSSTLRNPSHLYTAPGTYDVRLIVTSALGCRDTLLREDYISVSGPTGTFTFDPPTGCLGQQVDFAAVTQNTVGRTWDFGDGTILSAGDTVSHIYNVPGIFHPIILLDDGMGCIFAINSPDSIIIGDIVPDFTATEVDPCPYENIQFTDISSVFPNTVSRKWYFGDGDSSVAASPTHAYDTAGYFDVTLIVYNGICYDTITKPSYIYVTPFPHANFTMSAASGCENVNVIFNENAVTDTAITQWQWTFGDGGTDSVQSPAHSFTVGTYSVHLVATSMKGCSDSITKSITVYPNPTAFAGADATVCNGTPFQFNATGGLTYVWTPDTGIDNDSISNPVATPSDTTNYVLRVVDVNGCEDTDTVTLNVKPVPVATTINDVEICAGNSVEIFASGGDTYAWTPDQVLSCDSCPNPIATPAFTTQFTVTVSNSYNCQDTAEVVVTVRELPQGIITPDADLCIGDSMQLEAVGGAVHFWGQGSSLTCTACANPIAFPDTTTMYPIIMYNVYGCERQDTVLVTVHPLPDITISAPPICEGDTGQITSTGGAIYNWTPSNGLSCNNCPNPLAYPPSTRTYHLEVISSYACVNYDSVTVEILPDPEVHTIEDATICAGDEIVLTTTYFGTDSIHWGPVEGLKASNLANPDAKPTTTTTYTVTAINDAGCFDQDDVTITVITRVEASVNGDVEICDGESIQLEGQIDVEGNMGSSVVWFPVNNLDNPTSLTPTVNPRQTITYTMVASSGSCTPDSNEVTVTVHMLPTVDLLSPIRVLEGTALTLNPITTAVVSEYNWDFNSVLSCLDCENPVAAIGTADERFKLQILDEHGCPAEDSMDVQVIGTCQENIFVPEAFSPNGDDINDKLYVRGLVSTLKYFRVFDRWGNLVFTTTDPNEGWDGVYKGHRMNPAVFVYSVEGTCQNGKPIFKKGNVTLIR